MLTLVASTMLLIQHAPAVGSKSYLMVSFVITLMLTLNILCIALHIIYLVDFFIARRDLIIESNIEAPPEIYYRPTRSGDEE
jgi:hypothetical protein